MNQLLGLSSSSEIKGVMLSYTIQEAKSFQALYDLTVPVPNLVMLS